jgi:glucokinase
MILAGDIGGTKTTLALFEAAGDRLKTVRESTYPSQKYPTFDGILADFLKDGGESPPSAACFGVAGLVVGGRSHTTNLPWDLDERTLAQKTGIGRVKLLNDLEAAAYGMLYIAPVEKVVLQQGKTGPGDGNIGVVAAGTGLGEAMLYWDGEHYHPIASEGGHADFGPSTPDQVALLEYLGRELGGHVSWERVLSGPGFHEIYRFLRDTGREPEPPELAEKLSVGDPNVLISELGLAGTDPLCVATVDLFCSIYGSEAGNVALRSVALGGVFVGGGIAPKLLPALQKGSFVRAFSAKGRFTEFLQGLTVSVVLNPEAPLLGAGHYGLRLR